MRKLPRINTLIPQNIRILQSCEKTLCVSKNRWNKGFLTELMKVSYFHNKLQNDPKIRTSEYNSHQGSLSAPSTSDATKRLGTVSRDSLSSHVTLFLHHVTFCKSHDPSRGHGCKDLWLEEYLQNSTIPSHGPPLFGRIHAWNPSSRSYREAGPLLQRS